MGCFLVSFDIKYNIDKTREILYTYKILLDKHSISIY